MLFLLDMSYILGYSSSSVWHKLSFTAHRKHVFRLMHYMLRYVMNNTQVRAAHLTLLFIDKNQNNAADS